MYLSQPSTITIEKSKVEATSQRRTKNWYFSASRRETPLNLILCFLALFSPPPYDPPRLLQTWLIATSVYPPIATLLPSLVFHNRRRIFSIRSWQTYTTIGSVSQARECDDQGSYIYGAQERRNPFYRERGIAVVSRRDGERAPAVRKLLEVSGNWR